MITLDQIWLDLSTKQIGFYTHRNASDIPNVKGIYGWFFPLRLNMEPENLLSIARKLFAYDSSTKGIGTWTSNNGGFRWDPLKIEVSRIPEVADSEKRNEGWNILNDSSSDKLSVFKQAIMAGTIFAKPLYIGMATNLSQRYHDHIKGRGEGSTFHKRFTSYMEVLEIQLEVQQLLFVCIPLHLEATSSVEFSKEEIRAFEHFMQILCQPVFSHR